MEKWVSIIVPMHNCENTISTLLESILSQNMAKDEYDVILVNDNCTDNTLNITKQYESLMNIKYTNTNREIHCPGNSRNAGLAMAETDWVTFIDHDDWFLDEAFPQVKQLISENNYQLYVATFFNQYINNTNIIERQYTTPGDAASWLHGKWYNKPNLLDKYHIRFKDDMQSQEDIYFNNLIVASLLKDGIIAKTQLNYHPICTYHWNDNPASEGHRQMSVDGTVYSFIDYYFSDYLMSTMDPLFELIEDDNITEQAYNALLDQIIWNFLMAYFYFENMRYRLMDKSKAENFGLIHKYKEKITRYINNESIIRIVYQDIPAYYRHKLRVASSFGDFIEIESFRDFIYHI